MLMKGRLTINNSVCGRWLLSLFTMLLMSVAMQAGEYDLWVAGTQVTSDNAANITGTNITAGTVSFSNGTLTLNGATINGTIEKIANAAGDQLNINLVGTNTVNGQILFQSPDLMYPGDLSFTGTGSLNITSNDDVFYGVSSVNTGEGLYIATDSPDPQCRNGYYFASNSGDTTIKNVTVSTSVTYPIWVYNTSTTHYTQLTAAASTFTTPTANVDENHSGSVSFSNNTLTLTNFLCKTTENSEFVFFVGKSLDNLTVNLVGESSIYYNGFHYSQGEEDDEPTLTYTTSSNGRLTYTSEPSYWSYYVTVNYENGLGYYSNVISTDWPRLQIGNTYVRGTTNTVGNYSNVSFDDATNTLTLGGVTIGTQGATVTDITVYIKDLNVEISGTNTVYGRFFGFYEENGSRAGTITFKKKTGAGTANLTVSGFGEGGPVTNFISSTLEEGLFISGIDTDNEHVSSLSYHDGEYYDSEHSDNIVKEVLITSSEPIPLWVNGVQVNCDNATNVLGDEMKSVSYDATNQILTLRGANFDTNNPSAIVVGEEISALTLHLIGNSCIYSNEGPIISFANESSSLIVTTSEKLPGSLSATNLSTVQQTLQNGLTYTDGIISASLANAVVIRFTGRETSVNTDNGDNSYIYSYPNEFYASYATNVNGNKFVKVSTNGASTTATMWPSSLSNAELQKKVILQFGALTATSNVMVQVKGITNGTADGNTYSNAIALSNADSNGILTIPLTSAVTSENLQLVFSSSSSFSFMPISIAFSTSSSAESVLTVAGVEVTASGDVFTEGANEGKVTFDADNNKLTLNGAVLTGGIEWNSTSPFTIELNGENSITCSNETHAIMATSSDAYPTLSFVKAEGATNTSLTLTVLSEMEKAISGFSPVNHEGLFLVDNYGETLCTTVISTTLLGGDGTSQKPFIIATATDLKDFAYYINNEIIPTTSYAKLSGDIGQNGIDCSSVTVNPIGYGSVHFAGTFDGNGKSIKNLTIADEEGDCAGFFRFLDENGVIKDLTIDNLTLSGGNSSINNIGGLVAYLNGGTINNCTIKNSTISCKNNTQSPTVGGLVGQMSSGSITNSTVQACTVNAVTQDTGNSGPQANAGGIVGSASGGTITGCQVKGATTVLADYGERSASLTAGAIVGVKGSATYSDNIYEYTVSVTTEHPNNVTNAKSGYTHRGTNAETDPAGVVMYTKPVTLPAESAQVTVIGEEGTYYSSGVVSDAIVLNVAPGQTATLNARPGEGYAIASLTATNTTTSTTITTSSENIGDNITQYTFTMPDAPVTVVVATVAAYGISVAGVEVTELNYTDVLGDGKVSFVLPVQSLETPAESTPATLTLNGATINGSIVSSLGDGLTIHLVGSNVIDANNSYAFVSTITTSYKPLKFTTPDANAGQLLIKNTASQYYSRFSPSFNNGLTFDDADSQWLIGAAPKMTPGEGLYWPNQQYTVSGTTGGTLYYKNNLNSTEQAYVQPFTLTTGKHNLSAMKQIEINDVTFKLNGQGNLYIVHNKPGFSVSAGSYDEAQTVKLTNLPTLPENSAYYPQVWYYLNNSKNDSIQYTSANQTIAVNESTRVSVYIIDEDSGKVVKSAAVTAQYTIRQDPALRFYTSENSYMSTGSTENISYDDEYTSPVLKGKINGEYTAELTALGITYSSSDETVATIDQTGKITIVGGGYATITATSQQTDIYSASTTNFILKVRPADPNVSLEEGAYYTGKKLTMVRIGENGTMYYSYGYKEESERTVYPEGGISLPKGCYDFYPYTRCGTNEQNIWSYGNAHRMMYVYDQPTISKDAGTYDGEIEVEITNLPESGSYNADVYYYFDDDEDHAVQYTSGSKITVNESKTLNVYIYVEGDSSKNYKTDVIKRQYVIRQDAGLAYTQNNEPVEFAKYTIGGENNEDLPELVNENGVAVTYTSNDEQVATVNAQGKVTIVGIGETTIMATSAQTATLMAGEAAYTLRVYKDLNYESITVTVADATYTGEAVEPEVTVKDGTTDITELMIISYDNNVEVGDQASVTIVPNDDLEVNFYVGSRTKTFSIVTRTLEIGKDVNFASGQKWASFYTTTEDLLLPEGVMAYIVTAVGNDVATVKAINYVPKNVPVLIEKESTTMTDNTSAEGNLLQGTAESTAVSGIEGNVYVLYNGGFTRTTTGAIPAKRAYLVLEQVAGARLSIVEGEATDITSVGYDSVATDGSTYDMQGRKVESLSKKGLYIKNGRKVVIK